VRHHVFLAVKETLTNILKHAQASHVQIRLAMRAGKFDIVIADDGCGFNTAHNGGNGHGLVNLRERLLSVHGSCQMESQPGMGTRVEFVIPLPEQPP
jgi:signal transduction histidine kinase